MPAADATSNAASDIGLTVPAGEGNSSFQFIPSELTVKAGKLIESYHAIHGYGCLPDMLWHSDARDFVERHADLAKIFKAASKSRCAKRTNESLSQIATVIFALEMLARDFAGSGKRFPAERREAEKLLGDFPPQGRVWLMDAYLYPTPSIQRERADALTPSLAI
jgi:hypothetical protein